MAIIRGDTLRFLPQIFTFEVGYFAGVLNVVFAPFQHRFLHRCTESISGIVAFVRFYSVLAK